MSRDSWFGHQSRLLRPSRVRSAAGSLPGSLKGLPLVFASIFFVSDSWRDESLRREAMGTLGASGQSGKRLKPTGLIGSPDDAAQHGTRLSQEMLCPASSPCLTRRNRVWLQPGGRVGGRSFVTSEDILSLLKFSGPVVGLMAALWSTTQKITYEDEGGVKRLTLQGRVLIGITVAAAAISLLSIGLELIVGEQRAQEAARSEENAKQQKKRDAMDAKRTAEAREAAEKEERAREKQADLLRDIQADAAQQQRFLENRFLIIGAAAEQQRRDAQMSTQIAREANQRLSEAQRTLAEFERINYPLRTIVAEVTLVLNLGGADFSAFWNEMTELRDLQLVRQPHGDRDPLMELDRVRYPELARPLTASTYIRLEFVAPGAFPLPAAGAEDAILPLPLSGYGAGDSRVKVMIPVPMLRLQSVHADVRRRQVIARYDAEKQLELEGMVQGDKLSVSDVTAFVPILTVQQGNFRVQGKRQVPVLVAASFGLNDRAGFGVSSNIDIVGTHSFVLHMRSKRR
jgi:hypothetical protein